MAKVETIVTTGTGASDYLECERAGRYALLITWAGSPGDADLQVGDGVTFVDAYDCPNGSVINITAAREFNVAGGMSYRLDVNTHTSAATVLRRYIGE